MTTRQLNGIALIKKKIRDIPDFPKKGIIFKDITPVLKDAETLILVSELLQEPFKEIPINIVAGIESRGFILGPRLAADVNAGFVPVRKPGKLPGDKISESYKLEYGTDELEMHVDALQQGDRVVIHDDLMATGGSAMAATELVHRLGGIVVGYSFVMELTFLNGSAQLNTDIPIHSLVKF